MTVYLKLNDVCESIIDCPHESPEWLNEGVRVIRNFNLIDGQLDFSDAYYVDEETYKKRTRRTVPKAGDIIFSREAPIGNCAIIPENMKCCLGQRLVLLRVNHNVCSSEYLLTVLMSDYVKQQINQVSKRGSIVSNFAIEDLKELIIPIVDKKEEIAKIAELFRRKIKNNNQVNDNLQQQISTIYSYWFHQFNYPGNNGKLIWNNKVKRYIPDNWEVATVAQNPLCSFIKPGVECFETKTYLATADINNTSIGEGNKINYSTRESRANMQPVLLSVWFAKMKNSIKHIFINKELLPLMNEAILSTGFCGLQCSEISFEYIASFIQDANFERLKDIYAHGATQEAVNNDDLDGIYLLIPDQETLIKYHNIISPMFASFNKNIEENARLSTLRDWLLPMLMNGQVTIAD